MKIKFYSAARIASANTVLCGCVPGLGSSQKFGVPLIISEMAELKASDFKFDSCQLVHCASKKSPQL